MNTIQILPHFDHNEIETLNKGIKYSPNQHLTPKLFQPLVIDTEIALRDQPIPIKTEIAIKINKPTVNLIPLNPTIMKKE